MTPSGSMPPRRQVLGFVARRLLAESVAIVFAVRDPTDERELAGLPELTLAGLPEEDARALLATVIPGRLDERVRDRLVAETRGNPLAILELPRALAATQLPGGFGLETARMRCRGGSRRASCERLEALPDGRAAAAAGGGGGAGRRPAAGVARGRASSASAARRRADATEGLLAIGERVTFRHPLVRSAVYRSAARAGAPGGAPGAGGGDRSRRSTRTVVRGIWPRRRRLRTSDVAAGARALRGRAQARGGLGAAAAFLERGRHAVARPVAPSRRGCWRRPAPSAMPARSTPHCGCSARSTPSALDELGRARVEMLRGQIAFDQLRAERGGAALLAGAAQTPRAAGPSAWRARRTSRRSARRCAPGDRDGPAGMRTIAEAALRAPPPHGSPAASDALLEGFALLLTEGHAAAAPSLRRARELRARPAPATDDHGHWLWFAVAGNAVTVAQELWDAEAWHALAARHEQFARDSRRPRAAASSRSTCSPGSDVLAGELTEAAQALEEERMIAEATGNRPIAYTEMLVAAWRGQDGRAAELIEATMREAPRARPGGRASRPTRARCSTTASGATPRPATPPARPSSRSRSGSGRSSCPSWPRPRPGPATPRCSRAALEWLAERTRVTPTDWALGTEARVRALLSEGEAAERAVPRGDRAPRPHTAAPGARPRASALRRVAAPRGPARGRARAAAHRPRDARRDRHGGVRRARPPRAAGDGREGAQAHRRDARRADRARSARSRGWPATACRTRRSARGSSSARAPSNGTCARCSPSSGSARAASWRTPCPAPSPSWPRLSSVIGGRLDDALPQMSLEVAGAHRETTTCLTSAM